MIDSRFAANGAVIDQSSITHQLGEVPSPRESENFDSIIRMRFPMAIKSSIKANKEEMTSSLRFIAVVVSDLRTAEQFYKGVFEMEVIGREAMLNDGLWYTLPFDKGWKDAEAADIELGMLALRKGEFVLVLFKGNAVDKQIYAVGLAMPAEEIARIRARLVEDTEVMEDEPAHLSFRDPYQIIWQISVPGVEFRTAGDFADRWLQL
jgi:catechol 2,3-dioxygenase-like lactoylglutathione lyase family enzyme